MKNHDPDCSPELIREHSAAIATTAQSLKDFMVRYDVDRKECAERYRMDRDEAREWRTAIDNRLQKLDAKLEDIGTFVKTARPVYDGVAKFIWIVILGALGIIFTIIWTHVNGGR